jgi:hypothetical protein
MTLSRIEYGEYIELERLDVSIVIEEIKTIYSSRMKNINFIVKVRQPVLQF